MINLLVEVACIRVYEGYTQPKNKKLPMVFDLIFSFILILLSHNSFSWFFASCLFVDWLTDWGSFLLICLSLQQFKWLMAAH